MKKCTKCGKEKPLTEFGKCCPTNPKGAHKDGLTYDCRECHNAARRFWVKTHRSLERAACKKYSEQNPTFKIWVGAKYRAKKFGKPFGITRHDIVIPTHCPVLGIELKFGVDHAIDSSPSLDCIVPALGYVLGNIAVISHKANTIKSNATAAELRAVAAWLDTHSGLA